MILKPKESVDIEYIKSYNRYSKHYEAFKLIDEALKEMRLPDIKYSSQGEIELIKIQVLNSECELAIIFKVNSIRSWGAYENYIRIYVRDSEFVKSFPKNTRKKITYEMNEYMLNNYSYLRYEIKYDSWGSYTYSTIYYGCDEKKYTPDLYKKEGEEIY